MKNIDKEYRIKQKRELKRFLVGTGISLTTLFVIYSTQKNNLPKTEAAPTTIENQDNSDFIECNGRDEYMYMYMENLKNINKEAYDQNFINIFKSSDDIKVIIDEEEFPIGSIYLAHTSDGKDHFFIAGENKTDIISKEEMIDKKIYYTLRDSSIFYQMYNDGLINDKEIKLSKEKMQGYLDNWDHEINSAIPEVQARYETNKEYSEKHGK